MLFIFKSHNRKSIPPPRQQNLNPGSLIPCWLLMAQAQTHPNAPIAPIVSINIWISLPVSENLKELLSLLEKLCWIAVAKPGQLNQFSLIVLSFEFFYIVLECVIYHKKIKVEGKSSLSLKSKLRSMTKRKN